ncbi:MAG: heavy metal-responsive transcriptional regulator [Acidobacteriota bacterium]|nr:heavy metal-responsive transcriptional regulator [Acidobacteriota bacterium]
MNGSDLFRIGDVARRCGVSDDTIRHYEAKGVIAPARRDANGYRRYDASVVDRVLLVRRALRLGFSLDELARIFKQRARGRPPCREVRSLAERKLAEVNERIAELIDLRETLAHTLETWNGRLDATRDGEPAHLLESLI